MSPTKRFKFKTEYVYILILFTIACTRSFWFSIDKIVTSGDLILPPNSLNFLKDRLYIWNEVDFGQPSILLARLISPLYLTMGVLNGIGVPTEWGQIVYSVLMYFLGSYAIYKLTKVFLPKTKGSSIPLFAAFFYLFNPLLINDGIQTSIMFLSSYVALPAVLYFYIQSLNKHSYRYAFVTALTLTFLASGIPSFRDLIIGLFLLGSYTVYYICTSRNFKNWLFIFGLIVVFTFILNLFWLFPFIMNPEQLLEKFNFLKAIPSNFFTHKYTTLLNVLRGFGKWSFFSSVQGIPYFAYSQCYNENVMVILTTFLLPIIVFSAFFFSRRRELLFMYSTALLFLFLSKGINPPGGELYALMVNAIPFFKAIRESFFFLQGLMIPYSFLYAYSCQGILDVLSKFVSKKLFSNFLKKRCLAKVVLIPLVVLPLFVISWPLLTGDVITLWSDPNWKGVTFPESYKEISKILEMNESTHVLVLPQSTSYVTYNWGYSGGRNVLNHLLPVPLVMSHPGDEYFPSTSIDFIQHLYNLAQTGEYHLLANLLSITGTEFIVIETGLTAELGEMATKYINDLNKSPYFTKVREFDEVVLFRVQYSSAMIYSPDKSVTYHEEVVPSNQYLVVNDLSNGWRGAPNIVTEYDGTVTRLEYDSSGQYIYCLKVVPLPFKGLHKGDYLVLPFKTSPEASVIVAIAQEKASDIYLNAMNPTPTHIRSAYTSDTLYTLIYRVPDDISDAISIKLYATNFLFREYAGTLSFFFGTLSIVEEIGGLIDAVSTIDSTQKQEWALLNLDDADINVTEIERIITNFSPDLTFFKKDKTRYVVEVNSTNPFVLILSQTYDDGWTAKIGSETIKNHFAINGFANGWIIGDSGQLRIILEYSPQRDVEIGRVLTIVAIFISLTWFLKKKIKYVFNFALQSGVQNEGSK